MKQNLTRRTRVLTKFDNELRRDCGGYLCGVDEAGRGPVAGPVVAAAVIFSDDVFIKGVFDSKQLTCKQREELYDSITETALSWAVGIIDNNEIDRINILKATKLAMDTAVGKLKHIPSLIVADGNFYDNQLAQVKNLVKADSKSFSVAAASIIAKVTRDRIMCEYEGTFPNFSFSVHKGYCTINHIDEILEYGYTTIHRRSFKLKAMQGELF